MSRRYGRNQKRRHRAELAAVQATLAEAQQRIANLMAIQSMDRGLISHQSECLADLRAQLRTIAQEIGHQSALLGEKTFLSHGFDGMRMMEPWKPLEPMGVIDPATASQWVKIATEVIRLLNVNVVRTRFYGHIHFDVDLAGEGVAYGISESAIRDLTPGFLERRIAPEIARRLVERLKKVDLDSI